MGVPVCPILTLAVHNTMTNPTPIVQKQFGSSLFNVQNIFDINSPCTNLYLVILLLKKYRRPRNSRVHKAPKNTFNSATKNNEVEMKSNLNSQHLLGYTCTCNFCGQKNLNFRPTDTSISTL